MENETVIEAPKATIYVERSVKIRDYESLKVGMHYPVDLPLPVAPGDEAFGAYLTEVDSALRAGFVTVKGHIFDQLNLQYEDKNGVLVEKVAAHFEGAAEVQTHAPSRPASAPAAGQPESCEGCGGTSFYDNRAKKASGEFKSNSPDFKCRGCQKGVWLTKKGSK